MATSWNGNISEDKKDGWGICCIYAMSDDFNQEHPELARRLVLAHALAIEYLYKHPYNAGMMFAEGFGVAPEVGLRTVYMKTVTEGRTITWEFSEENLENYIDYFYSYNIPEEEIPNIDDIENFMSTDLLETCGIGSFNEFIEKEVNEKFPIGMTYEEWLAKAKTIDGITE